MIERLINLNKEILALCNVVIDENVSPNVEIVGIIKQREFEKQYQSLTNEGKVIVLNKKKDLRATRTIADSGHFEYDKELFHKVFEFEKLCHKLPNDKLTVLY
ncbi:MAG: hypothetical protein K2M47_00035 [Clostridiales bacterium]|nr:hypothetical protein [Clostridiales bacterium]